MEGCRDADGKWVDGRDLAKGILWSKEVRWKWAVWNGVGAQGEGHDGVRGGCRATQSRVKSGVHGAGCSSGGMQSGVPGGRQGEGQSERRSAARSGRRSGRRCGAEWGGMGRGKNGVRNHFGRHFTNIVYIIKKMF